MKPEEHFYNKALITGSWEIYRETEGLALVLGFASDFQHNLRNHQFTWFYFLPQVLEKQS